MDEIIYLNKMLNSAKETIALKDIEIYDLKRLNIIHGNEKKQWVINKLIQDQVIHDTLSRVNQLNNQYLEEIQLLKIEINRLKNGDFN